MPNFQQVHCYMPVTMQQFESLTNELLLEVNKQCEPHALDANYMAQILMSALHAYDHKIGWVSKTELFDSCINRISCHVTYHAVQEIQQKLKAAMKPTLVESEDALTNDVPAG
jgi:hypothetical protein